MCVFVASADTAATGRIIRRMSGPHFRESARHPTVVRLASSTMTRAQVWLRWLIGAVEIGLGIWVLAAKWPRACAATQTLALVGMNALEITYARDLLWWPAGMVAANFCLIACAWWLAKR